PRLSFARRCELYGRRWSATLGEPSGPPVDSIRAASEAFQPGACRVRLAHGRAEGADEGCVFGAPLALDAAGDIHGPRSHSLDRLAHVLRGEAAGEDHGLGACRGGLAEGGPVERLTHAAGRAIDEHGGDLLDAAPLRQIGLDGFRV